VTTAATKARILPLTTDRWADLVVLFGERGAYNGCWCMWFRKPNAAWVSDIGEVNRRDLRELAATGRAPGLLAYVEDRPVGWVSVAPRIEFMRISGRPADTAGVAEADTVWSIVCFYIDRTHRRLGIGRALLAEAVGYAGQHGAHVVEAYPVDHEERTADANVYTGVVSMYRDAGFEPVGRFARWRAIPQVTDPVEPKPGPATGRPIYRKPVRRSRARTG
jgi:GNAT superfamily N-acetyltransferase